MQYGLYIHVPYCRSKCRYCDFYSAPGSRGVPEAYIDALLRDFARYAPRDAAGRVLPPVTVYFGGGTPGLLAPAQVERVMTVICPAAGAEVTLEANPDGCTEEWLAGWRAAGANRLSLGVQSARNDSLRRLGRLHTAQDAREALWRAAVAGFDNISVDIMLALPGYTNDEFDETLALAVQGGASHVSAYMLALEAGTPFGQAPPTGLPTADEAAGQYLHAVRALAWAGYAQYEISSFAQPGHEGRHNGIYWDCGNWLGLGPAAHSSLEGRRFSFGRDVAAFLADELPPQDEGEMTWEDYMMLRLRLVTGLEEEELVRRYGRGLSSEQTCLMQRLAEQRLARRTSGGWALTPEGLLVQNSILAQLLP